MSEYRRADSSVCTMCQGVTDRGGLCSVGETGRLTVTSSNPSRSLQWLRHSKGFWTPEVPTQYETSTIRDSSSSELKTSAETVRSAECSSPRLESVTLAARMRTAYVRLSRQHLNSRLLTAIMFARMERSVPRQHCGWHHFATTGYTWPAEEVLQVARDAGVVRDRGEIRGNLRHGSKLTLVMPT